MHRFRFICLIGLLSFSSWSCQKSKYQSESTTEQPNITFIMTDDHAYQAIGAYGSNLMETPHIDRLAEEGMLFDQAFVSNSICSPSRAVA